ncbi:LysM peptidoglycan-binding domain-containing protein [Gracilibacillus caseinilyticus]|uniref:LysM peptidoglycan-binding domain-containing protein n=1 Tax=Gracilibacillus caseinilyticus TaxID=2932256 RepID=A0ABY4F0G3_9BACI|nr:LysM peptidoglycan-binding domain-containing protein [Gracilibacillus caseinilyticus]UOQ50152.1 LysM peptidoglycan-binding domain-containing protein [Gracilibacillus caseinilyticus]
MTIHVVQSGESLWQIANQYQLTIATIMEVNGLPSANEIIPGLALYIPNVPFIQNRAYMVKAGDTTWLLANRFNTTIGAIVKENPGLDPAVIYAGQILMIPTAIRPQIETLGFVIPYSQESVLTVIRSLANLLTYVAVVSYSFTAEGYAYVLLDDKEVVRESNQLGVTPLLMIRNFTSEDFDAELAGNVFANPVYRRNLIDSLMRFVNEKGYGGVSLDIEFIPPARREDFNTFLQELKAALGSLILHVNVHAKSEDLPTNRIVGAYDYQQIGAIADIVAVMTIDYGYPGGPPDPVAPLWWMNEVVQYATSLINSRKLQIAFPLYGYDWRVSDNNTAGLSVNGAQNQAIAANTVIAYNQPAATPWYRYWDETEEHIVWFEDIRSYQAKYNVVDLYQLLGVTYWQLNLPAPQNWAYLNHYTVTKI